MMPISPGLVGSKELSSNDEDKDGNGRIFSLSAEHFYETCVDKSCPFLQRLASLEICTTCTRDTSLLVEVNHSNNLEKLTVLSVTLSIFILNNQFFAITTKFTVVLKFTISTFFVSLLKETHQLQCHNESHTNNIQRGN